MFIKILKYIALFFATLMTLLLLIVGILAIPSVTQKVITSSLKHFLEVNASVSQAKLSFQGLRASGRLNQKDRFELQAQLESLSKAVVTLHYDGDVNTFSKVATVELPYVATVLDARFSTDDLSLDLNATLLEGDLSANLSLMTWSYHYQIENLDLDSFRTQQKTPIDNYASGALSAKGNGIIEAPYTVTFWLTSQDLQLENNVTGLISPDLETPLPLDLEVKGSVGADTLLTQLTIESPLLDANISKFLYDFNQSTVQLHLDLLNHQKEIAPVQKLYVDCNTSIGNEINATYLLKADGYQLSTQRLTYDLNTSALELDYKLSSLESKPIDLQNENQLFGALSYRDDNLSLSLDAKSINSPILLTLQRNQLHVISNNIPLKSLQNIGNQEVVAEGDLFVEADANISSEPLLWSAYLSSKNLKLPLKYRKDIGLKNDLSLVLSANNEANGDIVLRPTLWSNIGLINYTALRYKPELSLLFFNFNAQKVKTAYYKTPKLNIKGSLNLKKSRLNKTVFTTPYENVVIKRVTYSDKGTKAQVKFMLSRLDRFGSLNPDYRLHGETFLNYTPEKTVVTLDSKELGHLDFQQKEKVITLSGDTLPLREINKLLNQPTILNGNLNYTLRYSASSIKATIDSEQIVGDGDFNTSVRPFKLDFATSLKYHKKRYQGSATLHTGNEHFKISNIVADLSKNRVSSRYKLKIDKLEENTFILPAELEGPLQLSGDFKQNVYQHLTLKLTDFQLPTKWHQKLEANATTPLETNATIELFNDKGLINFDGQVSTTLLKLNVEKSDFNLKTGDFHFNTDLKTKLWLKDTNISTAGSYKKTFITVPKATLDTAHQTIALEELHYTFKESNLTTKYSLRLKPYANAPYHSKASIYGDVKTKPNLDITMQSNSLGGDFSAHFTEKALHLNAKNISIVKLIEFSGQKVPISRGSFDATIDVSSPSLLEANLTTIRGQSDINITDMVLEGVELDSILKTLRNSQDLNLFQGGLSDLPLVRSIKEIPSDIVDEDTNSTHFQKMRFLTDINQTGLHCSDCAIATEENLIAIKGGINLEKETFNEFYVGMLFPNNCAYFIQQVDGNLSEPQVKLAAAGFKVVGGAAKSLIGNVGSVIDIGADVVKGTGHVIGDAASYVPVVGETADKALTSVTDAPKDGISKIQKCMPFYTGTVVYPQPLNKHPKEQ